MPKNLVETSLSHCVEHNVYFDQDFWQCNLCFKKLELDLKQAVGHVNAWREAWYQSRTDNGVLAWTVPNPHYLKNSSSLSGQAQYQRFLSFAKEFSNIELSPTGELLPVIPVQFEPDPFPQTEDERSGKWKYYQ